MKPSTVLQEALAEVAATYAERREMEQRSKQREEAAFKQVAVAIKESLADLSRDGWSHSIDHIYAEATTTEAAKSSWAGDPDRVAQYIRDNKGANLLFSVFRTVKPICNDVRISVTIRGVDQFVAWACQGYPIRGSEEGADAQS